MRVTLRVVELFAGIGAQRMALTLAGIPHEVVAISEIDRHALRSYEAVYGDCPNLGDITKVERLPPCDLVTWSFPCTSLSVAGKREGMAEGSGTASSLAWEVMRLLESADPRPEWLLMENVRQVLTAAEWPEVLRRLEAMGYRSRWAVLDASRFGSAQRRVRAFMASRLGQDPPDLPACVPCAPVLCLRDVMEPERAERYIRRIPMDRVRWRGGPDLPAASIEGETFYSKAMIYSSSSSPTLRTEHGKNCLVKVADVEGPREQAGRVYSSSSSSPSLMCHKGGDRHIKVVAEDSGRAYGSTAKVLSSSSSSPTLRAQVHGLQNHPAVMEQEDGGDLVVSVLTPREYWRLMGFPEWAYLRASRVCSETQLYNQAGNSIVVEVLMALFNAMFRPPRRRVQSTLEAVA